MDKEKQRIFEIQAELVAMFAHPKRLMIMDMLSLGEQSVGELAAELEVSLQNVSQHLRVMKDRGVLESRKAGQTVFYRITNPKFSQCCKLVRSAIIEERSRRGEILAQVPESQALTA